MFVAFKYKKIVFERMVLKMNRRKSKRLLATLLIMSCIAQTATVPQQCVLQTKAAQSTDYSQYSNTKYEWYIIRKTGHQKAGGGIPAGLELEDYSAYYIDTKTKEKVMYLTFDCGYENGYTKKILKTLKKHNAKAIFFVTKSFVESNPDLAKQMKKEGHLVGNHTTTHPSLPSKSVSGIKKEIKECATAFKKATGYTMDPFVRPPMGNYSKRTLQVLKDLGYKTIFWSIAYRDYDVNNQPGKEYVVNHFKENYHKGAVPLIHNTSQSNCEALDDVLTFLEEKKYRFGTVDEFTLKKGTLKISCANNVYDGKAATIKIVKNTNKKADITYTIKNKAGKTVKKAVNPGTYTVVAKAALTKTYRAVTSNKVTFTISKKATATATPSPTQTPSPTPAATEIPREEDGSVG